MINIININNNNNNNSNDININIILTTNDDKNTSLTFSVTSSYLNQPTLYSKCLIFFNILSLHRFQNGTFVMTGWLSSHRPRVYHLTFAVNLHFNLKILSKMK